MFKIESYITPLLMGYLDKYVRLRPEDFQLSLWGGDAVLYNLDLRLDIIEKAIQLPIVFQSGHIHELRLHVPWTKLGSDPVVVTINTIECILKLRDTAYEGRSSRASSESPRKSVQKQKTRKQDSVDLPPGYLQSLMNKIVNNVSIIVNNLIVKFVEDDIVLSLNVKSAECYSVDKNWNRAFVELFAPDFVLRRTVNFCDVTVCLDKRDASGKIDHYQDPMVYRCSVVCRLFTKYENIHSKYPLETKLNIYCERLDLSLTDVQLPMLLRLIELCLALYYGTLDFKKLQDKDEPDQQSLDRETKDNSVGEPPPEDGQQQQQGWASWAWSYVPQILPEDEEDLEPEARLPRKPPPSIFSLGMYAYKTTVKFKMTEYIKEKAHYGPKKIVFKPFLYLESEGISFEVLMQDYTFFNAQFGITCISVYSQGVCICGAEGEENSRNNLLFSGGDSLQNKTTTNYICQSLFDAQSSENLGVPMTKILDFDEHRQIYTEQYGLQKYGVFWMDYLYGMARQDDKDKNTSSKSSVSSVDGSTVFVQENSLSRFVVGRCHLNISSTTVHRIQKVLDAAYKNEYEPYSKPQEERVDESRPHPTEEQVQSLEEFIPTRTYHLTFLQPIISVLSAEHPYCDISKKKYHSPQHKGKTSQPPTLHPLFGMQITSQRFDLQTTSPMYPRKTVQMISKIIGPSSNLMHHCHSHTQTKIFGIQVGLTKVDIVGSRSPVLTIVPPTSGALYTRRLLLPVYWKNSYLPKLEKVYELPQFSVNLSKPSIHVLMAIISSWKQNIPKPSSILSNSLMEDVFPSQEPGHITAVAQYPVLEISISGFEMKSCRNDIVTACSTTLSSINVLVYKVENNRTTITPILSCPNSTDAMHTSDWLNNEDSSTVEEVKNDCLMLTYQLPRKYDKVQAPAVVLVNMEGTAVCLDPILLSLLSYKPVTKVTSEPQELKIELDLALVQASLPLQTNLSQVSVPSSGSKMQTSISLTQSPTLGNQSTQNAGSQKPTSDEKQEPASIGSKLAQIFPLIRVLQVQVEIKKTCIFVPKSHLDIIEPSVNIVGNLYKLSRSQSLCDMLVLCLPRLTIQSAGMKTMSAVQEIPITSVEGSLVGDKIPWNVSLHDMSSYTIHTGSTMKTYQLIKPATISCTVGVSYKYTPPTSDNISALGLCLHTDLRSIVVSTSVEQIKLLMDIVQSTMSIAVKSVKFFNQVSQSLAAETKPIYPSAEPNVAPNIDHTYTKATSATSVSHSDIPYTHTSGDVTSLDTTLSRDLEILEVEGDGVKLSLWLQCTLPKSEMRLYLKGKQDTKISAVLEDITLSVDIQEVYSKLKINVGAASILHFDRHSDGGQWETGLNEGILMSCRDILSKDTQIISSRLWSKDRRSSETPTVTMFIGNQPSREISHGFFSLTLTRALRKNVRKRLQKLNIEIPNLESTVGGGDMLNQFHFHKYVSEICINMTPCDFILCMPPIATVLANFSSLDVSKSSTQRTVLREKSREKTPAKPSLTTSNLPLLYAEISNMRLFVPGEKTEKKSGVKTTIDCDMFVLQVQSINITPHADNPLPRYAVDKELYQKAVQLGITSESGAAMSDKQFQIDVKGFSFTSGCWSDILKSKRDVTERHTLTPGTQIPAVEWNSLTIREEYEEVQLFPILSSCDLKLVLAPAMVNYTPQLGDTKLKMSLVCGHGIEFNIVSDLDLHVSTNQINLMYSKMTNCLKALNMSGTNLDDNMAEKDSVQDSGLGSEISAATTNQKSNVKLNANSKGQSKVNEALTPLDLLLTAGRMSCTFYSHVKTDKEIKLETSTKPQTGKKKEKAKKKPQFDWRVKTNSNYDQNEYADYQDPYLMRMYQLNLTSEEKVIPAGTTCIKPFLFCYVSQPHTVLSCQPDVQKFETSSYDVLVKGSTEMSYIPVSDVKLLPDCSDFTEYWFETRPGQPHPSTGIPASLYTLTVSNFLTKPAKISIKLERPLKTNVSFSKIIQAQDFYTLLFSKYQREDKETKKQTGKSNNNTSGGTLSFLNNISSVDFLTDQIVVAMETKACEENPELIASFSNFKSRIEFHHFDNELDSVLVNTYMRDLLVKTGYEKRQLNMLGPCSIKGDGTYTRIQHAGIQERWSQTVVTIATGLVTMHFGQEHALCLKLLGDHVQEFMKEVSLKNPKTKNETKPVNVNKDKTVLPPHVDFVVSESRDDLRSHEFNYIMDTDGNDLVPRSGEIVFCNKDMEGNSSMTWSYNEPRVISHMSSTPVPFFVSDVNNTYGNKVLCCVQYWECLIQQFMDYVDFDLLENDTTVVILPRINEYDKRNLVASQIWRILIRNDEGQIHVLPATLAASLNVTSCFIPSLIPSLQVGFTVESSQLHLTNHVHCLGKETPSKLSPFYMSTSYQPTGEFAVISLDNILIAGTCLQSQQNISQIQFSSQLALDLLEFKTLTMERVISSFNICGNSHLTCISQTNEKRINMLDVDISCDPVTVRVGKGIVHNLASSVEAWSQLFKEDIQEENEVIFGHYVICNNTQLPIRFGQVGTDENLVLQPREMYQYAWRSHIMKQELHVCMDGSIWKWCDSLDINKPGRYIRKITTLDQPYTLIITINRLSNVQNQVVISGLVTVSNRLSMNIEVKVNTTEREYQAIAGSDNVLPSYIIQPDTIQGIKLRPYGSTEDYTWSQEIHIGNVDQDTSESSLVKISEGTRTFHIWCQIIVRNIDKHPFVYVVLCPLYTLRSHLPQHLYVNIDTSKLNLHECIETPGRGRDTQLKCPGGDIHQSLTFQFSANSGRSNNCVTLSTGLIDQLHRSPLDDVNNDSLNNYWKNDTWFEWPYSQPVKLEPDTPKPDKQNVTVPDVGIINQPTIDLNISLSELWPGYQTILVNVAPSYLINNYTQLDLIFMGTEDVTFDLHKGHTICPPKLENSFHVGIKSGDIIHMSEPIPVSDEEVNAQRYRNDVGKTLYIDSYIHIPVLADNDGQSKILYLTIRSCFKHQIRIITITEQYNITNLTKYSLTANIISVPSWSNKVDFPSSEGFDIHSQLGCHRDKSDLDPISFHSLLYNTNSDKKYNIDRNTQFIKYLSLSSNAKSLESKNIDQSNLNEGKGEELHDKVTGDWSFPIRLVTSESGCRMTTSLSIWKKEKISQESLCISGIEKNGVTYLTIQLDQSPACYISNECSFPLHVGQTLMNLSLSGITIQEETELINPLPTIPVGGAMYYTPPYLNSTFPQVNDKHSIPRLHLRGYNVDQSDSTKLKWSNPIDLQIAADNFVSIPGIADVKIHVQQVAMVTRVTISPITKADISAKEIRSRLKGHEKNVIIDNKSVEHIDSKSVMADTLKQSLESEKPVNEEKQVEKKMETKWKVSSCVLMYKVSFIIQNENMPYSRGETIRLTLDNLFLAQYPASHLDLVENLDYHRNCVVCSIGDLQLDNQLHSNGDFDFPVIIVRQDYESNKYACDMEQLCQLNMVEKHAILKCDSIIHVQLVFGTMNGRSSVIETVDCAMKLLSFYVEDTFIYHCIKEAEGFLQVPMSIHEPLPVAVRKLPSPVKSLAKSMSSPIVIGKFSIQPVTMMMSVHASIKVFVASDHTPLTFGKFEKSHLCTTSYQLTRVLVMHYASGALFRAGAVVGSLEILGNPTGLVRSIGSGVADFFRMPYQGLTRGPGAFVKGISSGTSSMVKNITTGMLTSLTNFASSVSRNMDRLSLDSSHVRRQEEGRRHRPDGVSEGLKQGLTGLGISLLGAVAGLADQPIQSLVDTEDSHSKTSTASGLVTGVGKGLVGVFTKPIGGAAEFVSQTGQGILQGTGLSRMPSPRVTPDIIQISTVPCGQVKYALKLLQTLPSNDILCCVDAMFIDLTDNEEPVTLILTPEVLFVVNHEEDSQQQSFSILELECGVTQGDEPILSIIWRDSQTFNEDQLEPSHAERVTAFVDAASKYISTDSLAITALDKDKNKSVKTGTVNQTVNSLRQGSSLQNDQYQGTSLQHDQYNEERQSSVQGEQISDTVSESSVDQLVCGSFPQYDFKMRPTSLAAFLALFNITQHRLAGVGFVV